MPTGSRSRKKLHDEIRFPIRLRYAVPETGLGLNGDAIYHWLHDEVGKGEYAVNADSRPGTGDATSYYFRSSEASERFAAYMRSLGYELADSHLGSWRV